MEEHRHCLANSPGVPRFVIDSLQDSSHPNLLERDMANKNLNKAKEAKKDEFYTQLEDINNELRHYREHFRGKTVLCNCDDPRVSNFFKYFAYNFEFLCLKKLIATCYKSQDVNLFSEGTSEQAVYLVYEGDKNGNNIPDDEEIEVLPLKGDGDFRSAECIEFLKEADIVVTNPPFSLFREYITQLIKYNKKFLIIANKNSIATKDLFPYIQQNQVWSGFTPWAGGMWFETTGGFYDKQVNGKTISNVPAIWITNLDHRKRHEEIILYKTYTPDEYPTYENYDAIEVAKTSDIPMDYNGKMGVPLTFIDKYNPDQFEIIGIANGSELGVECGVSSNLDNIQFNTLVKENPNLRRGKVCYREKGGILKVCYNRVIIRRKQ